MRFFVFACGTRRNCQRLPYRCRNNREGWFEGSKLKVAQLGAVSTPFVPLSVVTAQEKFNGGGLSETHPIRRAARHATEQGRVTSSALMTKSKSFGMPTWLSTSRHAPVSDTLRTRQSIAAPRKEIVAPFKVRWRWLARCLFMAMAPFNSRAERAVALSFE